jgi:XRE family transcriptional regulator, regulator of sulfur utilization
MRARPARCPPDWRMVDCLGTRVPAPAASTLFIVKNHAMTDPIDPAGATTASHLARNLLSLRHTRALTQEGLAKGAGVPRSTIANLESGEGNPSLSVLVKVAGALGVPIDELLSSPRARVRRWNADEVAAKTKGRGVTIRPLVPEPVPDSMMEVMDFAPGAVMGGTPHLPGTREFFTCLEGTVRLLVAGEVYALGAGDVLAFPGNLPHSYQNADGVAPARGVSVVILAKAGT